MPLDLIDSILNVAALLLWMYWRMARATKPARRPGVSLTATLKTAGPARASGLIFLLSLAALLVLRAMFYWQAGPGAQWNARLDLGPALIHFRSDYLDRMLLYSLLSFGSALGFFLLSLLLISIVNHDDTSGSLWHEFVEAQVGPVHRLPLPLKAALPFLAVFLIGTLLGGYLVRLGLLSSPSQKGLPWQQSGLLSLRSYLLWKYLLVILLGFHLLNSYVYLGSSRLFEYMTITAKRLLAPLAWLPLRLGKLDLLPLLALLAIVFGAEYTRNALDRLFQTLGP